jgi:hypothetical protein
MDEIGWEEVNISVSEQFSRVNTATMNTYTHKCAAKIKK